MTLRPKNSRVHRESARSAMRANQFDHGEGATRNEISRSRPSPSIPTATSRRAVRLLEAPRRKRSFRRCEAQQPPRGAVGEEPQRAVRSLPHVANALAQFPQQALFPEHLVAVELEPQQ